MNFKKRVRFFVLLLVFALTLLNITYAFAQPNNRVSASVSDTYMTFPDGDIVSYEPLDWTHQWLFIMSNDVDETGASIVSPSIIVETSKNFVSFSENPIINLPFYTWQFIGEQPEQWHFHGNAREPGYISSFKPKAAIVRTVTPGTLVDAETIQEVDVSVEIKEPFPPDVNNLRVGVGTWNTVQWGVPLVEYEVIGNNSVSGWNAYNDGKSVQWNTIPANIEVGRTYNFQAQVKATKSPLLLGTPISKPRVDFGFEHHGEHQDLGVGKSATIVYSPDLKTTFKTDNDVAWEGYTSWSRYEIIMLPVISEFTSPPPPFHVLIPADIRIEPETLNLKERGVFATFSGLFQRQNIEPKALDVKPKIPDIKSKMLNSEDKGVFTAFIKLPEEYNVNDIDVTTVKAEGASATKGVVANDTLIVKFKTQDLQDVEPGEEVELTVSGELKDGSIFKGTDIVRVIN